MTNPGDCQPQILAGAETTAGRLALVETREQPGHEPPCHRHHWEEELLYVVEGELAVWVAGAWHTAAPGRAVVVPRGAEHTFSVLTPTARVLAAFAPAGFEGFYRELRAAEAAPLRHAVERWVAAAARYGCEVTGPHPGRPEGDRVSE